VTTATKLRAAGIAGIGVLWGSLLAALGMAALGFAVVLLGCVGAGVALAVPTRWHLLRLRYRTQAAGTNARAQGARVAHSAAVGATAARARGGRFARSVLAGANIATSAARTQSERAARTAAARAPAVKTQLAQLPRRIAQPLDRSPDELLAASNRARRDGRINRAVASATKAADGFRAENDPHGEALALNSLALAQASARRYTDAVAALDRALTLVAQTDKRHDEGRILANLGVVHRKAGGAEAAKECLAQALERLDSDSRESEHAAALLRATG
jgi:tetratricopeptide (TPR) repeat protein